MRIVLQRVSAARVLVDGLVRGEIGVGLVALVGVGSASTEDDARWLAAKTQSMRLFAADDEGPMDRCVADVGGGVLAISQFTLYADTRKGRRPSFLDAARPDVGEHLYEVYCEALTVPVSRGVFGAHMLIDMTADGPVTLLLGREGGVAPSRTA